MPEKYSLEESVNANSNHSVGISQHHREEVLEIDCNHAILLGVAHTESLRQTLYGHTEHDEFIYGDLFVVLAMCRQLLRELRRKVEAHL